MYQQKNSAAKNEENCCCDTKRQLINNYKLFETLKVCPKFVTFQKFGAPYSAKVTITNTFHKIRTFDITTNFPNYLSYKIFESELNLIPDISTKMIIYLHANKRSLKENERFSIFLHSRHPDMTMEIPIILLTEKSDANVCYPKFIKMPDTSPRIRCYYAFPIYNHFKNGICYKLNVVNAAISTKYFNIYSNCNFIIPNDCSMVYFDAYSENFCNVQPDLIIRFGDGVKSKFNMKVLCEIKEYMLYCNSVLIRFPETFLGLSTNESVKLCNESDIPIKYKWCNHETKSESIKAKDNFNSNDSNIFNVEPNCGSLVPYSSECIKFTFTPLKKIPDDFTLYPYQFKSTAYLDCSTNWKTRNFIYLHGIGIGSNLQINPTEINLQNIFIGQKRCIEIYIKNLGAIVGKIKFNKFITVLPSATCLVHPDEILLNPKESEIVKIDYYTSSLGSFLDEIQFKIECGEERTVIIKGNSIPFPLDITPKVLEIGNIPMCILQKHYFTIKNPINSPIIVKLCIINDGTDPPLFLNINEIVKSKLDILDLISLTSNHVRSEDSNNIEYQSAIQSSSSSTASDFDYWIYSSATNLRKKKDDERDMKKPAERETANKLRYVNFNLSNSAISYEENEGYCDEIISDCKDYDIDFADKTLDKSISLMVNNILNYLRNLNNSEKSNNASENDVKLIETIFDELKSTEVFRRYLKSWNKFTDINWDDLPFNAKECMIEKRPIYFGPNENKSILICLIPNTCGKITKTIRACASPCNLDNNLENIPNEINSIDMTTSLDVNYTCLYPKIELKTNKIKLLGYVEKPIYFKLTLHNISDIMGFVKFKIQPRTKDGRILINPQKFLIAAKGKKMIHCKADLFLAGNYCINGTIYVIGTCIDIPYKIHIIAKPPSFKVKPKFITDDLNVLNEKVYKLFIHNTSPTIGRFKILFKNNTIYLDCFPRGGILGPGQGILILIRAYYYDPDIYRDSLQIHVTHMGIISIPIKFIIKGIPISSIPNLEHKVDYGYLFTTKELKPYKKPIQFVNHGERMYLLNMKRLDNIPEEYADTLIFQFEAKQITILPKSITPTNILIASKKPIKLNDKFNISCTFNKNQHCNLYKFNVLAELIKPKVKWNINHIDFIIDYTEFTNRNKSSELVRLFNTAKIPINVLLVATNHYSMIILGKCTNKRQKSKKVHLTITPEGSVDFIVLFEENSVPKQVNKTVEYDGNIVTRAEEYIQKSLHINTSISYPLLKICIPTQFYFSNGLKFVAKFIIANTGRVLTHYEWNFLTETLIHQVYIETDKMKKQRNISEMILTNTIKNLLTEPIDIEEEYMASLEKWENYNLENAKNFRKCSKTSNKTSGSSSRTRTKTDTTSQTTTSNKTASSAVSDTTTLTSTKFTEDEDFEQIYNEILYYLDEIAPVKKPTIYDKGLSTIKDSTTKLHYEPSNDSITSRDLSNEHYMVLLDHYVGTMNAGEYSNNYFFFNNDYNQLTAMSSAFELKLIGGEDDELNIIIYNTVGKIEISETNIDLGTQPWYKKFDIKLRLVNPNYNIFNINIVRPCLKLVEGYIKNLKSHNTIYLSKYPKSIRFQIFVGIYEYFNESVGIEVNDTVPVLIKFKCNSKIPWLSILGVERPNLVNFNSNIQYETLNYMWKKYIINIEIPICPPTVDEIKKFLIYLKNFEDDYLLENPKMRFNKNVSISAFDEILEEEIEEEEDENIECTLEKNYTKNYSIMPSNGIIYKTFYTKSKFSANLIHEYDKDLNGFIVLDYSVKYPNALEIELLIEKQSFIKNISLDKQLKRNFNKFVNKYVTHYTKANCGIFYKTFIVRPIPYLATEYQYDFGDIYLNTENLYELKMVFHGPGQVILSARTDILLPGFEVTFEYPKQDVEMIILTTEFTIYLTPHNSTNPIPDPYLNRFERDSSILSYMAADVCCANCKMCGEICKNCQIKICHPHSFDLSEASLVHRRDILLNRRFVNDHYTKLNQSFKEQKNPLILCELFQKDGGQIKDELLLNLKIKFTPSTQFYKRRQIFDDFLFIDVHLGPTIPILLNGRFMLPYQNSTTSTFNLSDVDYGISRSL